MTSIDLELHSFSRRLTASQSLSLVPYVLGHARRVSRCHRGMSMTHWPRVYSTLTLSACRTSRTKSAMIAGRDPGDARPHLDLGGLHVERDDLAQRQDVLHQAGVRGPRHARRSPASPARCPTGRSAPGSAGRGRSGSAKTRPRSSSRAWSAVSPRSSAMRPTSMPRASPRQIAMASWGLSACSRGGRRGDHVDGEDGRLAGDLGALVEAAPAPTPSPSPGRGGLRRPGVARRFCGAAGSHASASHRSRSSLGTGPGRGRSRRRCGRRHSRSSGRTFSSWRAWVTAVGSVIVNRLIGPCACDVGVVAAVQQGAQLVAVQRRDRVELGVDQAGGDVAQLDQFAGLGDAGSWRCRCPPTRCRSSARSGPSSAW